MDFDIKRGERIAIIGNNGTGKTTILKIINGLVEQDAGKSRWAPGSISDTTIRNTRCFHMDKTLFQEIQDTYPNMNNTQIRNVLAAFLFTGDDVFKLIRDLSGGERGRVSLPKLMLSEANFLILDEPTNPPGHYVQGNTGKCPCQLYGNRTLCLHDRYFINKTATRILDLKLGNLINYIGNYDYYLEKRDDGTALYSGGRLCRLCRQGGCIFCFFQGPALLRWTGNSRRGTGADSEKTECPEENGGRRYMPLRPGIRRSTVCSAWKRSFPMSQRLMELNQGKGFHRIQA